MTKFGQRGIVLNQRGHDPATDKIIKLDAIKLDHIPNCCWQSEIHPS